MRKILITTLILVVAIMAVSCGQKTEAPVSASGEFYYANFAEAENAAAVSGKHLVLDFYTDW